MILLLLFLTLRFRSPFSFFFCNNIRRNKMLSYPYGEERKSAARSGMKGMLRSSERRQRAASPAMKFNSFPILYRECFGFKVICSESRAHAPERKRKTDKTFTNQTESHDLMGFFLLPGGELFSSLAFIKIRRCGRRMGERALAVHRLPRVARKEFYSAQYFTSHKKEY
jgi:hypothetical protein